MKRKLRALSALLLAAITTGAAFGASTRTWKGGDGDYGDPAMWSNNIVPMGSEHARFEDCQGDRVRIEENAAYTAGRYYCYDSDVIFTGSGTVRGNYVFFRNATITVTEDATFGVYRPDKASQGPSESENLSFSVTNNGTLIMANLDNNVTNLSISGNGTFWQFGNGGMSIQSGGRFVQAGGLFTNIYDTTISSGAEFSISAGLLKTRNFKFESGATATFAGGETIVSSKMSFLEGAVARFLGDAEVTGDKEFAQAEIEVSEGGVVSNILSKSTFSKIKLSENARLVFDGICSLTGGDLEGDGTGVIVINIPEGQAGGIYHLYSVDDADSIGVQVGFELAGDCEGWDIKEVGPFLIVTSGSDVEPTEDFEWTGAVDNKWSTPGNWHGGVVPTNGIRIYLSGDSNTEIDNDLDNMSYYQVYVKGGSAPFVIDGFAFTLTSTASRTDNSPVCNRNTQPLIFRNLVKYNGSNFNPLQWARSYVSFVGGVEVNNLRPCCIDASQLRKKIK